MSNTLLKKVTASASALSIVLSIVSPIVGVKAADVSTDAANRLAALGVINDNSKDPTKYNLGSSITRREMLKIMMNLSSVEVTDTCEGKFSDLPKTDWGCKYAEAALKAGFIAANPKFRPNDMVTEAESLKMVMQARGLEKAKKCDADGKNCVDYDDFFEAYRIAAVDNGIISADTKINSKAAAKRSMVVVSADSAFTATASDSDYADIDDTDVSSDDTDVSSDDTDVNFEDMFGDDLFGDDTDTDVTTTDTTSTGTTGTTTDTSTSTGTTSTGTTTTDTSVKNGDLEITLNPTSPVSTNVPCNANSLVFGKYDFTAGSKDASVNSVTLRRVGLGTKDDFSKVWFENQSGIRVTSRQTIGSDDVVVLTFSPTLVIKAGSTESLNLTAKLKAFNDTNSNGIKDTAESCYTGRMDAFVLSAKTDIDANGGNVSGTYPITTSMMSTADYSTANLTSAIVASAPTYQVGELNQEFAQWRLTNNHSTRDIVMKTLTVKNEGTGKVSKDLDKLTITVNGNVISSGAIVSGEYVTFNLNNYVLAAGRTESFYIRADVVGMDSATADTINFTVRYSEDLNAIESNTGFGVSHNLDTVMVSTATSSYTIQGGDTTFVKSSTAPASMTKPKSATNVTFLEANLIVKQDFNTDAIKVKLYSNADAGATTLTAADLKNLKLYVDNTLVQTKSGDASDFTTATVDNATFGAGGSNYILNFDSSVTLKQGTRVIKLVGDIETNAVPNHTYRAEIAGASAFLSAKYTSNDRSISAVAGTVTGGDVTIGSSNITITENSGYATAQKFVAGTQNLIAAKYSLKANDSDDVKVTRLKFTLTGNGVNGSDIPSAAVFVDGVQKGSTKSFTTGVGGSVDFTDVNFTIASNKQSTIELKIGLTNSAAGNLTLSLANIDVKDTSSTDANINSVATTTPNIASIALNISTGGTLSINNNSNTVSSAILVPSTSTGSEQEIAKFTLSAQDDDIKVTNLYFKTEDGASSATSIGSRIKTIALYDNSGVKVSDGIVSGNYVYFDIGDSSKLIVPKNSNSYTVVVRATFNSITQVAQTGTKIQLVVNGKPTDAKSGTDATSGVRAVSMGNNNVLTTVSEVGAVASNVMYLTKTKLTFAYVDDSTLYSQSTKLAVNTGLKAYAFSVTADASGDAELKSVVLDITSSNVGTTYSNVKVYEKGNESNVIYNGAYTSGDQLAFATAQRISASTTKTYIVELNVNAVAVNSSISIKLKDGANDSSFTNSPNLTTTSTIWSDLSDITHTTPAVGTDWFNGYKLSGLNSMNSRSYNSN